MQNGQYFWSKGELFRYNAETHDVEFDCNGNTMCMERCEHTCDRYYFCSQIADADDALRYAECE